MNEELKGKLLKSEEELQLKTVAVDDMNAHEVVLLVEREESNRKFDSIERQYDELNSSSKKKVAKDDKLLKE